MNHGELSTAGSPAILEKIPRTGGFATPPYGRFAFVSVRPEGRGSLIRVGPTPFGCSALYFFQKSAQADAACAKYRHTQIRNKGEFVAHRRHNSWSACAAGNELESYQRGADEISRAPLRLMSHARLAIIPHAPALRVHGPGVNAARAFRYVAALMKFALCERRNVHEAWRCKQGKTCELVRPRTVVRRSQRRRCGRCPVLNGHKKKRQDFLPLSQ